MSEQDNSTESEKNTLNEVVTKIVITPEDVAGAADFWTHFEVPMTSALKEAFEAFSKNQTIENQNNIKIAVCNAIRTTDHEAFNDEMFKEIREECTDTEYDMAFNRQLEAKLSEDEK